MTYLEKLTAMAAECGLDWDVAKHIPPVSFAFLLDSVRMNKKGKENDQAK